LNIIGFRFGDSRKVPAAEGMDEQKLRKKHDAPKWSGPNFEGDQMKINHCLELAVGCMFEKR